MLTETKTYNKPNVTAVVSVAQPATSRLSDHYLSRPAQFLMVLVQFALIAMVIDYWQLESQPLARLIWLAFAGFIVHHSLPQRFRLPFFAMLSLFAVITAVGHFGPNIGIAWLTGKITTTVFLYHLFPGVTLIVIGLGLIGLCHLPIRFGARAVLVIIAGAGLAVVRAHTHWFPDVTEIWVVLGSMFMFRLMIYLYDLKHRTAPFSPAYAASYFFMLPNVCFPLFPVVDYKTFCSTYYNEAWPRVYQTGLNWMLRGVIQLLLYRVIYQFAPLDVYKLSSALDVAGCMLGMYLLYLRISGTFHLIVGLLHMFGFNLPETHHLYLLASSFTDFWRCINSYSNGFVMKLFFYPARFKLRRIGPLWAISIATLATFFATWLLHSWQWFWIRGSFLFNWKDFSFWMILAVLVLVTAIYETTRGRKRTLTPARVTLRQRLILGLQAAGVFAFMCVLWSYWSCQTWAEFEALIDAAARPTLHEVLIVLATLLVICVCGMLWGWSSRETSEGRGTQATRSPFHFWRSAGAVTAGALCLLVAPSAVERTSPGSKNVVARLHGDTLNARDMAQQRRGYYEDLDVDPTDSWRGHLEQEGFEFQPDAAILSVTAVDEQFVASHLAKALIQGVEPSPGYREIVQSVVGRAHVNGKMPAVMIEHRLQPYYAELCRWSFQRFAQQCAQRGVRPIVIYRPAPADFSGLESAVRSKMLAMARNAGLEVVDLSSAFDSVTDRSSLILAKWDDHTTALGHRMLADKLYEELVPRLFASPTKQQASRVRKP